MEAREARRAAERAARERLGGPLIAAIGELGVAVAQREAAVVGVGGAQVQARDHLRRAQQEADRIQATATEQVAAADEQYRHAHQTALAAGWSVEALADMGYAAPPGKRDRTPRTGRASRSPSPGDTEVREGDETSAA